MSRVLLSVTLLTAAPLSAEPLKVPFCELVQDADRYADRLVQIEATYATHEGAGFLYDLACNTEDAYVDLRAECPDADDCSRETDILIADLRSDVGSQSWRSRVILSGHLKRWNGTGYGVLANLPLQFRVRDVLDAASIEDEEPWPDQAPREPAPFLRTIDRIRETDRALCLAVAVGDRAGIRRLTTEEYEFTEGQEPTTGREGFLDTLEPWCASASAARCEPYSVNIAQGLGFAAGIMTCAGRHPRLYSQTYAPQGTGWLGVRGQLQISLEKAAADLFAELIGTYGQPHEWIEVDANELPPAYVEACSDVLRQLAGLGFEHLGTILDLTLADLHPEGFAFSAVLTRDDGAVTADVGLVGDNVLLGLTTEFTDGRTVKTDNSGFDVLTAPPTLDRLVLPRDTSPERVWAVHKERIASPTYSAATPVRARGLIEAGEAEQRRFTIEREHRQALGYLTRDELERMVARDELRGAPLDALWHELRLLIESYGGAPPSD